MGSCLQVFDSGCLLLAANLSAGDKAVSTPYMYERVVPLQIRFEDCRVSAFLASQKGLLAVDADQMTIEIIVAGKGFATMVTENFWRRRGRIRRCE